MINKVTHISLLVRDQEEALQWYMEKLDFEKRADDPFPGGEGRWLTIAPQGQQELEIVLQPPEWGLSSDAESRAQMIGKTPGWVLISDDCRQDYETLKARGVNFVSPPENCHGGCQQYLRIFTGTNIICWNLAQCKLTKGSRTSRASGPAFLFAQNQLNSLGTLCGTLPGTNRSRRQAIL